MKLGKFETDLIKDRIEHAKELSNSNPAFAKDYIANCVFGMVRYLNETGFNTRPLRPYLSELKSA